MHAPPLPPANDMPQLDLSGNAFIGELPAAWSAAGVFRSLRVLDLSDNELSVRPPTLSACLPVAGCACR